MEQVEHAKIPKKSEIGSFELLPESENEAYIDNLKNFTKLLVAEHIQNGGIYFRTVRNMREIEVVEVDLVARDIQPFLLWLSHHYFSRYYGGSLKIAEQKVLVDDMGMHRIPILKFNKNAVGYFVLYALFVRMVFIDYFASTRNKPVNLTNLHFLLNGLT